MEPAGLIVGRQREAAASASLVKAKVHKAALHAYCAQMVAAEPKKSRGTNLLMMQIGMFRLVQGAAYRVHRPQYAVHLETMENVVDLPYTFPNFVCFVNETVTMWMTMINTPDPRPLDNLRTCVNEENKRLQMRIREWETIEKTAAMLDCHSKMGFAQTSSQDDTPIPFIDSWSHVIMECHAEEVAGAMVPIRFWYDEFMPALLDACDFKSKSVKDGMEDLGALAHNSSDPDVWFADADKNKDFSRFGKDVKAAWPTLSHRHKIMVKQAWRLTGHYLNGVSKMRERSAETQITTDPEHRSSGDLSHYVCFIDVQLGCSCVQERQMRVSFPYYLGTSCWRFMHTIPEIAAQRPSIADPIRIQFKLWFLSFTKTYACPYCYHHLNDYVVKNSELDKYPIEYILLGWSELAMRDEGEGYAGFNMTLEDKMNTIKDVPTMRLFLWKLHNTVSSSVSRSENWYSRIDNAPYTQRFWPNMESEIALRTKRKAVADDVIPTDRVCKLYSVTKISVQLGLIRENIIKVKDGMGCMTEEIDRALRLIKKQEKVIMANHFLEEEYQFVPLMKEEAPRFTEQEEEFARDGHFDLSLL